MSAARTGGWLWGPVAAATLVVAACLSVGFGILGGIPLFDGLAPPPLYRWVDPPAALKGENRAPDSATATLPLTPTGTVSQDVATQDQQVLVSLPDRAFAPEAGQASVSIAIRPLGPETVAPPPPGVVIQGNVYEIDARYQPSGITATATQVVDVVLRYPVDATTVILDAGAPARTGAAAGSWEAVPTTLQPVALAVDGHTTRFGLFAAATTGVVPAPPARIPAWVYAALGLALVLAAVPTLLLRRRRATAG